MTENVIDQPSHGPRGQKEITNPYLISARYAQSYPVYSWKCKCSSSDKLYRKRETSLFNPYLTPGVKLKFRNFIAHLQGIPNHILEYSVLFVNSIKWRQSSSDNIFTKNVIFPLIDHWGVNESSETLEICKTWQTTRYVDRIQVTRHSSNGRTEGIIPEPFKKVQV